MPGGIPGGVPDGVPDTVPGAFTVIQCARLSIRVEGKALLRRCQGDAKAMPRRCWHRDFHTARGRHLEGNNLARLRAGRLS